MSQLADHTVERESERCVLLNLLFIQALNGLDEGYLHWEGPPALLSLLI